MLATAKSLSEPRAPRNRCAGGQPADSQRVAFAPGGERLGPLWSRGKLGWLETRRSEEFADFGVAHPSVRLSDGRFSADGRILAIGHSDMVILCDPERGRVFRTKMEWRMSACVFHPQKNDLLVTSTNGLLRYRPRFSTSGQLSFSRPEVIHPSAAWRVLTFSADGQRFAGFNSQSNAAFVLDHTLTNRLAALAPHTGTEAISLSPDGRWLATGSRSDRAVRLWDVATEKLILTLPVGLLPRAAFSNDGRWLAVTGDQFELRETGSWKLAPPLPFRKGRPILGAAAFSPDGRVLAVVVDRFTVHLFDLQRFESIGVLRPPNSVQMRGLAFSPDGSRLAGFGPEARVAVWNLHGLRQRLAEFKLSWD